MIRHMCSECGGDTVLSSFEIIEDSFTCFHCGKGNDISDPSKREMIGALMDAVNHLSDRIDELEEKVNP